MIGKIYSISIWIQSVAIPLVALNCSYLLENTRKSDPSMAGNPKRCYSFSLVRKEYWINNNTNYYVMQIKLIIRPTFLRMNRYL